MGTLQHLAEQNLGVKVEFSFENGQFFARRKKGRFENSPEHRRQKRLGREAKADGAQYPEAGNGSVLASLEGK